MKKDNFVKIRKARKEDARSIAHHLLLAMEDIVYGFIGQVNHKEAISFMQRFVEKRNNQYSYENCFVAEKGEEVIGTINVYDGAKLEQLRKPVVEYIREHYNSSFDPEDETQQGEYYIDTLGVEECYQKQGVGKMLLEYVITLYVKQNSLVLGLLVEESKPMVERFYLKLGFRKIGSKLLCDTALNWLQYRIV